MLDPNRETPKAIREAVTRWGKLNEYGQPIWRVVLAQLCIVRRAGVLHELPTGEVSCFAKAPDGKVVYQTVPDRQTAGIMDIPKYPCEGWVIEKWFPATTWGSREEWDSHVSENGTRLMGAYPERGDYWMMAGPFDKIPEISDIEQAISMHEVAMRNRPVNYAKHFQQVIKSEEDAREERRRKLETDLAYMRNNELVPVLKSGSLAAQRFRNELNQSIGDRTHLGAVHDA